MLKNIITFLNLCCQFTRFGLKNWWIGTVSGLSNEKRSIGPMRMQPKTTFSLYKIHRLRDDGYGEGTLPLWIEHETNDCCF